MKTIMAKTSLDSSLSFSKRHFFNLRKKSKDEEEEEEDMEQNLTFSSSSHFSFDDHHIHHEKHDECINSSSLPPSPKKKKLSFSKLKSVFTFSKSKSVYRSSIGTKMIGTIFGYRGGHVHIAFQEDCKLNPVFLIEIAAPTSVLVREMASGLVRIALECEKKTDKKGIKLLEENLWRSYCNGKKCGYASRRECGAEEWKVLKAVEPISMGAGVIPGRKKGDEEEEEGEIMYMRAKFERVVGSKDSEAFYMMNPDDGSGGPELSVYLLRVV